MEQSLTEFFNQDLWSSSVGPCPSIFSVARISMKEVAIAQAVQSSPFINGHFFGFPCLSDMKKLRIKGLCIIACRMTLM